jgi:hypothetical protein
LKSVCAGIEVVPVVVAPVISAGTVAVQAIVALAGVGVRATALLVPPLHIVSFALEKLTVGEGLTIM